MTVVHARDLREDDPRRGFRHAGEFFLAVTKEGKNFSNPTDERLRIGSVAPTTFGNEASGPDGGFAVPPEFAGQVATLVDTEDSLLPFCDVTETDSNSMAFPQSEVTPWGTTGVRAYWQAEALIGTQTKPALRNAVLRLKKLLGLVPVSDELTEDAAALATFLPTVLAGSVRWKVNEGLLFGPGDQQPLGAFVSPAVITIAKESGQAANTIQPANLGKMLGRLPSGSFGRAVWLLNSDLYTNLFTMTGAPASILMPGGRDLVPSANLSVAGILMNRPVFVSEHPKAFSSQGDALLVDPWYIRVLQKAGGAQIAQSLHVYFDADATAYRISFRLDAQPKITSTIAPYNGSTQKSPFVQLGAR